jgi:DNA-binding GntR family transcriptional regulator
VEQRRLWMQVADDIANHITTGAWPPRHRIPSVRALIAHYGTPAPDHPRASAAPVRHALDYWRAAGVLATTPGQGTHVVRTPRDDERPAGPRAATLDELAAQVRDLTLQVADLRAQLAAHEHHSHEHPPADRPRRARRPRPATNGEPP